MRSYQKPRLIKGLLTILLNTEFDAITQYAVRTAVGRAVSTCIFVLSYDRLTKSSDEMLTKTS